MMALTTPTTEEINDNIIAQLEATLNQTIPLLPKSFLRVLAKVLSGVFVLLYKYGGFIFLQMFVSTASIATTTINGVITSPLLQWGKLIGAPDPVPAVAAELNVNVTVTNQAGFLPSGSQLVNTDNGVTYITIGAVLLNAPTVSVLIRAASDQGGGDGSGAVGNLNVSDVVSFANPLANVARDSIVTSQVTQGVDAEATDLYRQRIIDLFKKRPQGGAYADYETWAEEVAGIINAYPYTSVNPGQVDVFIEATVASSGSVDGIPTPAQLQAALDSIELNQSGLATRRPAGALVNSFAITRTGFDVTVSGLVVDDLATVQATIEASITETFLAGEPFIDGLTVPPRRDRISRSSLISVVNDIVFANNGTFTTLTFQDTVAAIPIETYVLGQGEKAKLTNPVTFV